MLYSKINQLEAPVTTARRKGRVCIELPNLLCGKAKWKILCIPLKLECCKDMKKKEKLFTCFVVSYYSSKETKKKKHKSNLYVVKDFQISQRKYSLLPHKTTK